MGSGEHWDDVPLALVDGKRLRSVTAAAGRCRVRAGMTIAEAQALCSDLRVRPWDADVVRGGVIRATGELLAASPQLSPVVGSPGVWWVGGGGMDAIGGDVALAGALRAIARRWHPLPRVAVADSCVAARGATWSGAASGGVDVIIPPGGCASYLFNVPLAIIPMSEELRGTLRALGITTAGGFAALDGADVERRWGSEGLLSWRLCRGEDRRRPVLVRAAVERSVSADLPEGTHTVGELIFVVNAALTRLVAALVSDGRAAASLAITLVLDDGRGLLPSGGAAHTVTREVRPAHPLARVAPLRELCGALLSGWKLSAPVCGVTVSVTATAPLSAEQGSLLEREWRDPAAAEAAFDRLRAELGAGSVVRPLAHDTHRLERSGSWLPLGEGCGLAASEELGGAGKDSGPGVTAAPVFVNSWVPGAGARGRERVEAAMRILDPAEEVEVRSVDQEPRMVRWRSCDMRVAYAAGPERLSGEWWQDGYFRDYWCCEEEGTGVRMVIYRDRVARKWYLQGWWD